MFLWEIIEYAKTKSDIIAKLDGTYIPKERREEMDVAEGNVEMGEAGQKEEGLFLVFVGWLLLAPKAESKKRVIPQQKPAPPNKTLYVQNLPENVSEVILQTLFERYPGFKEIRVIPGGRGIAFVEYQNEMQAAVALNELHGFRLEGDYTMVISFQKK